MQEFRAFGNEDERTADMNLKLVNSVKAGLSRKNSKHNSRVVSQEREPKLEADKENWAAKEVSS